MSAAVQDELLESLATATAGEYEILAELGQGGMATVFLAHDIALNRKVAVKVISPALLQGSGTLERFKREALTAASLSHPHIIPIHAVKESGNLVFFVMKCVEGRTLRSIERAVGQLPIPMVQAILAQVGGALGYAHRRGVIHRDVKPDNIMIDDEGWVVVTDFGIAKMVEASELTATGMAIGTPAYMSPEQCSGEPVTGASDQYSLGVVAYEMLAGKPPFTSPTLMGMMWAHVNKPPGPLSSVRRDCPPALADAVTRMLAKDAKDRFPSVEEAIATVGPVTLSHDDPVRTSLIELAKTGDAAKIVARVRTPGSPVPLDKRATPPGATPERPRRRTGLWLGTGIVTAIAVSVVLWLRWPSPPVSAHTQPGDVLQGEPLVVPAPPAPVASLIIPSPAGPLVPGGALSLSATALDASGNTMAGAPVAWASSDPAVATVSQDGVVSGRTPGVARITARSGQHTATVVVSVAEPTPTRPSRAAVVAVNVEPAIDTLLVGERLQVAARARDAEGSVVTGRPVAWGSSDPGIAAVSPDGIVTAIRAGTASITATIGRHSAQAVLVVAVQPVAIIEVADVPQPLAVGESAALRTRLLAADGRVLVGHAVRWSSSDPQVAAVSSEGVVTGVNPGRATVIAASGGQSTVIDVIVASPAEETPAPATFKPVIEAVLQGYARALSARDIDAVKRVFPSLPPDREGAWLDLFDLGALSVTIDRVQLVELRGDTADVTFRQTIEGSRLERNTTAFVARLVRSEGDWSITSMR